MLFGVKFRQLMLQSRSEACRNMLRDHCRCKKVAKTTTALVACTNKRFEKWGSGIQAKEAGDCRPQSLATSPPN